MDDGFGVIDSSKCYTHKELAKRLDRKERWMKEFIIRRRIPYADFGNGLMIVSGRSFQLGIERDETWDEDE